MKTKQWSLLVITVCLAYSCSFFNKKAQCATSLEIFPEYGEDSRLIELDRVAVIDTATVIIYGKVIELKANEPLPITNIRLINEDSKHEAVSDIDGKFEFYHIQKGIYKLTADYIGHRQFIMDSLNLETGNVINLKIGMGSIGRDDFNE